MSAPETHRQIHLAAHFPGVNQQTVWSDPEAPASQVLRGVAARLDGPRGLEGRSLGITPR